MNRRFPLLAVVTATACMALSGPAFSKALVVRSAGPSAKAYPPGKALPDSAKISLQPGDSLTILGPGSKRTLRGPGTFTTASGDAQAMTASKRARFGAMRTGDLALNPSPWNLDVTQSGTMCIGASGLQMWRPNSEEAAKLSISTDCGPATTVDWPRASRRCPGRGRSRSRTVPNISWRLLAARHPNGSSSRCCPQFPRV